MHIEPDNVMFNKASIIERSLKRVREEYIKNPTLDNYTHIDAMILNIERACQAAIDLASHTVAVLHLGIPQNSGEAFTLLNKNKTISENICKSMVGMTDFRNVAIHEYQELEIEVLRAIAEKEYKTLIDFCLELGVKILV